MDFRSLIKSNRPVLLDGAMGTELMKRGLEPSGLVNLSHREAVKDIHRDYFRAGSDAVLTNTFTANRIYLETHGLDCDVDAVNRTGVKAAKEVCPKGKYVLGDLGTTGQLLEPLSNYTEEQFYLNFKEQARILWESGVDGFIIETQTDLREALCALRACKDLCDLPVIVSFAFSRTPKGFATMMGNFLKDCAGQAAAQGADVIGANCGDLEPLDMQEIVAEIRSITRLPIIVQPNAGKPQLLGGVTSYNMSPELFSAGIAKCIEAGAQLVGGCCGTTFEHIQRVGKLIEEIYGS
ncbi:MAG: homocysteine S-methyltransferase family protein [Clostridia bacterium]|jgi:5-methyltetrahydrofolate--homocysteine methyltransferase|nr:homocysteine S-methyltransferase family protein [Clostridia bacterium]